MPEDARFLVTAALEHAERRRGRLRAITVGAPHEAVVELVQDALRAAGRTDVEVLFELGAEGVRLLAIEVESTS